MSSLSKIKDNSHKDGWMQKDLLLHLLGKVPDKSDGAEKKIRTEQKQVSGYSINKALKQIKDKEYVAVLKKLADDKYASLKNEQPLIRKKKTIDYLLQKGFEGELVRGVVGKE